jgi:hypothetical protein
MDFFSKNELEERLKLFFPAPMFFRLPRSNPTISNFVEKCHRDINIMNAERVESFVKFNILILSKAMDRPLSRSIKRLLVANR